MASLNKVIILGNLGQEVELRNTTGGTPVCNLSVATTDRVKQKDGSYQDATEWHRITVYGKTAENCQKYLSKGRTVLVEGKLMTRSWTDRDGVKKYSTEILASNVNFVGGGNGGSRQSETKRQESAGEPDPW